MPTGILRFSSALDLRRQPLRQRHAAAADADEGEQIEVLGLFQDFMRQAHQRPVDLGGAHELGFFAREGHKAPKDRVSRVEAVSYQVSAIQGRKVIPRDRHVTLESCAHPTRDAERALCREAFRIAEFPAHSELGVLVPDDGGLTNAPSVTNCCASDVIERAGVISSNL